jgi:hypothetical protein
MSYIVLRGRWCNIIVLNAHAPTEEKGDISKDSSYEELEEVFDHFPKYDMKILLVDFNAKVGREDTFTPTTGNESLHQDSKYHDVRVVNLDNQCEFRRNSSTTDRIFSIRQILEKKWEYNEAVHQLFIDFKKAYDSVRRKVLYNIVIEIGIVMKLVRLIKMCPSETCCRVPVGKHLSETFPIKKGLK